MADVNLKSITHLEIAAFGMSLGWGHRKGDRPMGSIWPRTDLRTSDHTLKKRIEQGWLIPRTEAEYKAHLEGKKPARARAPEPVKEEVPETPPKEDPPEEEPEKESEEEDPPEEDPPEEEPPEEPPEETSEDEPEEDPEEDPPEERDGDEYWEKNKIAPGKAMCPHCKKEYRGKDNLVACCSDK